MANKVNATPALPTPTSLYTLPAVGEFLTTLIQSLFSELTSDATRLNNAMMMDGSETPTAPVIFKSYLKAALPSASKYVNGMIIVSNDVGGLTPAFSDGTNWRRVADRNVIS